jgi:tetratricopeptide (TPR) repeat protein
VSNQHIHDQLNRYLSFLTQDHSNIRLLVKISDLYLALENVEEAQNYLNQANAIDREACLGHQGLLHLNQGQLTQAKESFIEALGFEDTPALRYNLGFTHFMSADMQSASDVLSPLLTGEHHPEAKLLLARILHHQDDLVKAQNLVNDVLTHNPEDSEALGLQALLYFDMNECELAAQIAKCALGLNPDNYDAKLINVMSGLTTQETTVEEVEDLLQISPEDCRLWFAIGCVNMSQGNLTIATNNLKKALEIYPEFYDCHIALGWCLLLQDDFDGALNTYTIAANLIAELADAWGGLALVYALQEDFPQAEPFIRQSKELNTDCFLTQIAEAIYFNHLNPLEAKKHLVSALKSSQVNVAEKLAFMIEEIEGSTQWH